MIKTQLFRVDNVTDAKLALDGYFEIEDIMPKDVISITQSSVLQGFDIITNILLVYEVNEVIENSC